GASRHGLGGNSNTAPAPAGVNRAACITPERTSNCGSPQSTTASMSIEPSESTNTTRPGCSACAERTNPHTAAPAKSLQSSPAKPTAPCVSTTNRPLASSASHDCNFSSTSCVAACTPPTTSSAWTVGSHTTAPLLLL